MAAIEVSRTLVKSPPELWDELRGDALLRAVGAVEVQATAHERQLTWSGAGTRGTALLEPAGWGTKVTFTAELEEAAAVHGLWRRLRGARSTTPARSGELERELESLLDDLGAAHRRPFSRG